jgi:hypothetical protein
MLVIVIRILIGILLMIHGFAHWNITTGWQTGGTAESWVLSGAGAATVQSVGNALWIAAVVVFLAAGISEFAALAWWRPLAIAGAVISLAVIALYWQPAMVVGAIVDVGILAALLLANLPSTFPAGS